MATSKNNLSLVVNQQDASGTNIINRQIGAVSFSGVAGEFDTRTAPDTAQHVLDLPTPIILNFYFKNTHATARITLVGTPQGGASVTLAKLEPGAVFACWNPGTSGTAGFTDLRYTSDTTGATFEMFLGG